MQIVDRKDSKLLGRSEVRVLFAGKSGALKRKEAIQEVASALKTSEAKVTLVKLEGKSGTQDLLGWFHVYDSEEGKKEGSSAYLAARLLTKEEKEALKQEKKKAEAAAAAAKAATPKK